MIKPGILRDPFTIFINVSLPQCYMIKPGILRDPLYNFHKCLFTAMLMSFWVRLLSTSLTFSPVFSNFPKMNFFVWRGKVQCSTVQSSQFWKKFSFLENGAVLISSFPTFGGKAACDRCSEWLADLAMCNAITQHGISELLTRRLNHVS